MHMVKKVFQNRRTGTLLPVILFSALVFVLAGCGRDPVAAPAPLLAEGKPFPAISLSLPDGRAVSTQSFRGKVVVLNVWASWCPPCRREMPGLEQLSRMLDPARFAVIGMSTDEDARLAEEFLQQNGITFSNFFDRNGRIARQLGLEVYPETFVIGPDGMLMQRLAGYRDWTGEDTFLLLEQASGRQPKSKSL